ncbi:putative ribonuclease H-like domain-containing protein [Tanacetum coccineum]
MSTANQQTLTESGAESRPSILEKGSYVPWACRFLRFLDNKREEGQLMRHSIDNGPYKRKEIVDLNDDTQTILEPIKKLSPQDQKQYYADIKERHSRFMNECDKFVDEDGASLTSMYERFSTLINIMDRNEVTPKEISINTKLLNSLQPKWSKYVTLTRQKFVLEKEHFDVANSHANHSYSYASPSYSRSLQPYYVTHPTSVIDNDDDYQGEIQGDAQEDKLSTAMMLLCYNCNGKGHYARDCPKPRVRNAKYFREHILLARKDEAKVHLDEEENEFMLVNAYGDDMLEELSASMITMTRIQPTDDKSDAESTYDTELISDVDASQINMINGLLSKSDHEH